MIGTDWKLVETELLDIVKERVASLGDAITLEDKIKEMINDLKG